MENKCKATIVKATSLIIFKRSDTVTDTYGVTRVKRKYGKFKREPVVCYPVDDNQK